MTISTYEVILRSAEKALRLQRSDGSLPPGHNGPWNTVETPVRSTAHWAMTFHKAYDVSGQTRFLDAALSACNYLLAVQARPYGGAFYCLRCSNVNPSNGLIGQVWAMEPLISLGHQLRIQEYLTLSRQVMLMHRFEDKIHLWRNIDLHGKEGSVNATLNQQIWFAACHVTLGKILGDRTLTVRAADFFGCLNRSAIFLDRGLFCHTVAPSTVENPSWVRIVAKELQARSPSRPVQALGILLSALRRPLVGRSRRIRELSVGYLPFILCGLGVAYVSSREERWWQTPWVRSTLCEAFRLIQSEPYYLESRASKYAWGYNPTGIEIGYALEVFRDLTAINATIRPVRWWVQQQLKYHWDRSSGLMLLNTPDPETLSARLYELTRLPDMELDLG